MGEKQEKQEKHLSAPSSQSQSSLLMIAMAAQILLAQLLLLGAINDSFNPAELLLKVRLLSRCKSTVNITRLSTVNCVTFGPEVLIKPINR